MESIRWNFFMEGFGEYLADAHDDRLQMEAFHGTHTYEEAVEAVCRQIDNACLIPYLMLKHKNEKGPLEDYIWHWFILAGYEKKRMIFWSKLFRMGNINGFP